MGRQAHGDSPPVLKPAKHPGPIAGNEIFRHEQIRKSQWMVPSEFRNSGNEKTNHPGHASPCESAPVEETIPL